MERRRISFLTNQKRFMKKFDFDEIDRNEWINLGFYYSYSKALRRWEFTGDKTGLRNFYQKLLAYANSPANYQLSEHIHLGPYAFLKIVTWDRPVINKDGFYGGLDDLKRLANIFVTKLDSTTENKSFTIDKDYSEKNEASLMVNVKEEGFDPSALD